MPKKDDPYSSSGIEINIRNEFLNTIYGSTQEIAKGQKGLLRKFRLESGKKIKCYCVSSVTGEPDRETLCPSCLGEGYLWDEINIEFYRARISSDTSFSKDNQFAPTMLNSMLEVFYIPHKYSLTKDDKLIVLNLDKEGLSLNSRKTVYRIAELDELRLDNGKLEFWKAFTYEDNNKFL